MEKNEMEETEMRDTGIQVESERVPEIILVPELESVQGKKAETIYMKVLALLGTAEMHLNRFIQNSMELSNLVVNSGRRVNEMASKVRDAVELVSEMDDRMEDLSDQMSNLSKALDKAQKQGIKVHALTYDGDEGVKASANTAEDAAGNSGNGLEMAYANAQDEFLCSLEATVRLHNALVCAGVSCMEDLEKLTPDDILELRNVGRHTLNELRMLMAERGAYLKNDEAYMEFKTKRKIIEIDSLKDLLDGAYKFKCIGDIRTTRLIMAALERSGIEPTISEIRARRKGHASYHIDGIGPGYSAILHMALQWLDAER